MVCRCEKSKTGIREKDFCFDIDLGSSLQLKYWDIWGHWMGYHSKKKNVQKKKRGHEGMQASVWEEPASETWCSEYSQVDHRRREGTRKGTLHELTILLGARPGLRSYWLVWTKRHFMKHLLSSSLFCPLTLLPHQGAED